MQKSKFENNLHKEVISLYEELNLKLSAERRELEEKFDKSLLDNMKQMDAGM